MEYLNCQDLCSDSFHWKKRLAGSGILKLLTALLCYNASTLLNIHGICVLLQNILKIHPKGMATFKKIIIGALKLILQGVTQHLGLKECSGVNFINKFWHLKRQFFGV